MIITSNRIGRKLEIKVECLATTITLLYGKTDAMELCSGFRKAADLMDSQIESMPEQLDVRAESLLNAREALEEAFRKKDQDGH